MAVEVKQYVNKGLKTLVPRLMGQTAEVSMRKNFSNKRLDETTFLENLDDDEAVFYKNLLDFAKEKQLLIEWTPMSFSLKVVREENNVSILRGYCKLSSYGQTLFTTVGDITSKVPDGDLIVDEYKNGMKNIGKKLQTATFLISMKWMKKNLKSFMKF